MTVKELIEELEKFDPSLIVATYDSEWSVWGSLFSVNLVENRPVDYNKQEQFVGIQ